VGEKRDLSQGSILKPFWCIAYAKLRCAYRGTGFWCRIGTTWFAFELPSLLYHGRSACKADWIGDMSVPLCLIIHSKRKSNGYYFICLRTLRTLCFGVRLSMSRRDFYVDIVRKTRCVWFCKPCILWAWLGGVNVEQTQQYSELLKAGSPRWKCNAGAIFATNSGTLKFSNEFARHRSFYAVLISLWGNQEEGFRYHETIGPSGYHFDMFCLRIGVPGYSFGWDWCRRVEGPCFWRVAERVELLGV